MLLAYDGVEMTQETAAPQTRDQLRNAILQGRVPAWRAAGRGPAERALRSEPVHGACGRSSRRDGLIEIQRNRGAQVRKVSLPEAIDRRCCVIGSAGVVNLGRRPISDRVDECRERSGDPSSGWSIGTDFVVAAAQVLHEGVAGDDHLCGRVRT